MSDWDFEQYEKTGYLTEDCRLFHIRDQVEKTIDFHYHDFYKIIYFVDGRVDYHIEGKTYQLKPHDFVMVGANEIHKPVIDSSKPYDRYIIYLSDSFLNRGNGKDVTLRECFERAQKMQNRVVHFIPESYEGILGSLLKIEQIGKQAGQYLNEILLEAAFLDVDTLAEKFYISKYYLMRQFKLATGYSIHQYINEKRILAARRMILAGMPPSKACYECGFHDYSTFARRFKEILQVSPSKLGL